MSRFRTRWLALVGAMLLIALSASSALGAHPSHSDNRGNAVSSFVHDLLFGTDEDPEEQEEEGDDEEEGDEEELDEEEGDEEELDEEEQVEEDGEFRNHGHCVREVAWSLEVGGLNENHGGAVSEAARVTCWPDPDDESTEGEGDEEGDAEGESLESDDSAGPGKSASAHERAPGKNKDAARGAGNGHGNGHGRGGPR